VLNNSVEAEGFWTMPDLEEHITFTELKTVRYSIKAFLPELKGKRILLHEDNRYVIRVLTHMTSKSPTMTRELRKLFLLTDTHVRHQDPHPLHPQRGQRLGREPLPSLRQLGLTARPTQIPAPQQNLVHPHSRQIRVLQQQTSPPLQRQVAKGHSRGRGLSPPP
jgi:hypothetical protein